MFPETKKKLDALSVEDKRALSRYIAANSESKSVTAFIEGVEARSKKPFDMLEDMVLVGALMVKGNVAEGFEETVSFA